MPPAKKKITIKRPASPASAAERGESSKNVKIDDDADERVSSAAGKRVRFVKVKEEPQDEVDLPPETTRPRRAGKQVKEDLDEDKTPSTSTSRPSSSNLLRTVIIEACTQCKSFKERADMVKKGLESAIPGISVEINPQTPRRGYFEVREARTEVLLSLPSMRRPFKKMKDLNMDEVIKELIKQCK